MTLAEAVARLGLAGRELGSGPALAAERINPNVNELELVELGFKGENAVAANVGIALQLLMSEDPDAMKALEEIEREWRTRCPYCGGKLGELLRPPQGGNAWRTCEDCGNNIYREGDGE